MIRQKFDADLVSCLPLTSKAFAVVQLSTWRESEKIPYIHCLPDSNHCLNFLLGQKKGEKTYCISWATHLRQTTVRPGVSTSPHKKHNTYILCLVLLPLSLQTVQAPFFRQFPLCIVFCKPP